MRVEREKWTLNQLSRLIDLMEANQFLFDMRHKDYGNRVKKRFAFVDITEQMLKIRPSVTLDIVQSKIKSLRDCYLKEKKKVEQSKRNGDEEIYRPRMRLYERLHFTQSQPRRGIPSGPTLENTLPNIQHLPETFIIPHSSPEATQTSIFLDSEPVDTDEDICQTSPSRSSMSQEVWVAQPTASNVEQKVDEITEKKQEISNDRDYDFLAFLGKQLKSVEDDDILRELMQKLLSEVFAAQVAQKELKKRQKAVTLHPPTVPASTENIYPACSSPLPPLVPCIFQRRLSSPSASVASSPLLSSRSCTPEVTTSIKSPDCSRIQTPTISVSTSLLPCQSRPPKLHSTQSNTQRLYASPNLEESNPKKCSPPQIISPDCSSTSRPRTTNISFSTPVVSHHPVTHSTASPTNLPASSTNPQNKQGFYVLSDETGNTDYLSSIVNDERVDFNIRNKLNCHVNVRLV